MQKWIAPLIVIVLILGIISLCVGFYNSGKDAKCDELFRAVNSPETLIFVQEVCK